MADGGRRLRALESAAGEANRSLEQRTATLRDQWKDGARREFDGEYVVPVVGAGHLLRDELGAIAAIAERVTNELGTR